jgi:hypothetical protein
MRLSYANVMSTIAVFVALGGTSYAALKVTGKNVRDGSLTGKDVKNRSLGARDIKSGVLSGGGPGREGKPGQDAIAPAGAVMFFDLPSCPAGWSEFTQARGRYVVGLTAGGTLRGTSGTPLNDQEARPVGEHSHSGMFNHVHAINVVVGTGTAVSGVLFGSGANAAFVQTAAPVPDTFFTNNAGSVAGTNAPYVQLRACRKS